MGTKKFTFKTEKPTGKYKSFDPTTYYIKLDGYKVGLINEDKPHKISLMVEKNERFTDNNPNCPWKWITLKHESNSIDEAKLWLNENFTAINQIAILYKLEK